MPGVRRGRGPGGRSRISVLASVPFRSAAGRGAGARARVCCGAAFSDRPVRPSRDVEQKQSESGVW